MSPWLLLTGSALAVLVVAALAARRRPPVQLRATVARPCAVYIIPSRSSRPAYIGEGYDPYRRIACHRREARWWPLVDTAREPTIEWLPSKTAARAREQELIGRLAPYGNDRHNHGPGRAKDPRHSTIGRFTGEKQRHRQWAHHPSTARRRDRHPG